MLMSALRLMTKTKTRTMIDTLDADTNDLYSVAQYPPLSQDEDANTRPDKREVR